MDPAEVLDRHDTPAGPPQLTPWRDADARLFAGFMGRRGGVSLGAYASLNLAGWIGDEPSAVAENWRRWRVAYPKLRPAILTQIHRAQVIRVRRGDTILQGARPPADGMVTTDSGIALGVFSADCVPVLLYDATAHAAAALHAGWRGTLANIVAAGLDAMVEAGAQHDQIRAAIGPAIGPCCFEVDVELADEFRRRIPGAAAFMQFRRLGKAYLDLRSIVRSQLAAAGLDPRQIGTIGPCTRCNPDDYFSRRGAGGAVTGLQMSFIGFNE
jgi:polyphenol oxidase